MQDLEELLAQMADARKIYGKELVAPYHGSNGVFGSEHGLPHQDAVDNERDLCPAMVVLGLEEALIEQRGCSSKVQQPQ